MEVEAVVVAVVTEVALADVTAPAAVVATSSRLWQMTTAFLSGLSLMK